MKSYSLTFSLFLLACLIGWHPAAPARQVTSQSTTTIKLNPDNENPKMQYAIAIHGGAGSSPENFTRQSNDARRASMRKALEIGTEPLHQSHEVGHCLTWMVDIVLHA